MQILSLKTLVVMSSACLVAVLCVLPQTMQIFPFWIIARGSFVMDTLFHEMGHSVYGWLFGYINIPMIFTFFHADKMGVMDLVISHSKLLQYAVPFLLAYGCYYVRGFWPFIPAVIFTIIITVISLSGYDQVAIDYMGHGSAIMAGGFFLYRAWANFTPRGTLEKWLSAYFGFFLTLNNIYFSYRLISDSDFLAEYMDPVEFIEHRDFIKVADALSVSLHSIAIFTICYGIFMLVVPVIAAIFTAEELD